MTIKKYSPDFYPPHDSLHTYCIGASHVPFITIPLCLKLLIEERPSIQDHDSSHRKYPLDSTGPRDSFLDRSIYGDIRREN